MTSTAYKALQARRDANARFDLEHSGWLIEGRWQRMPKPSWTRGQPVTRAVTFEALIARAAKEVRVNA